MARSRRKTSIAGITTADSEKQDKRLANRRGRRRNRQILEITLDDTRLLQKRQIGDPWLMDNDGKAFFASEKYPKLMRK